MEIVSDILLSAGALGAAFYCLVLSRRLRSFNQLENGMGGAIATLSMQVDDMTRALGSARSTAEVSTDRLAALTDRAAGATQQLELLLAALHDLPDEPGHPAATATRPSRSAPGGARLVRRRQRDQRRGGTA